MRFSFSFWILLLCLTPALHGQNSQPVNRPISLQEAIRMALERNLDIKLGQLTPQIGRLNIEGAYSYYDPVFASRASQNYVERPANFDPALGVVAGSSTWTEDFRLGLSGNLPTGARYDLAGRLTRTSGDAFERLQDPVSTNFTFVGVTVPFQYQNDVTITLTQPFLRNFWTDAGRTDIKLAKSDYKRSALAVQFTVMDVVHQVSQSYYDLVAARDQVEVRKMAVQLKEQFLSETKKKVEAGTLAPLDEKQAESEAATARSDLIKARYDAEAAENILKGLITDNFSSLHSMTLDPSEKLIAVAQLFNVIESWRNGVEKRPDYLEKKERLERERISLKFTYNQLFPSLDVQGTYGRNGLGGTWGNSIDTLADAQFEKWGGAVIFTLPLTRKAERATHKIQKLNVEAAVLDMKKTEEVIIRDIDDAVKKIRSAYAAIESTREARVFAEAALDAEQKKLENGKSTNFQVLELQDKVTQARATEISALTAYNKALYDLYFREGTILERSKITVEVK
jgi:outer membrane protein TolC